MTTGGAPAGGDEPGKHGDEPGKHADGEGGGQPADSALPGAGSTLPGADDPELETAGAMFRAELRAEAAEWEQLAATDLLRRRTIVDAARELLARGDRVAVGVGGRSAQGEVVHVGDDVACVATAAGTVDVRLDGPAIWHVIQRVRSGGRSPAGGAKRFAARLAEHEAAGTPVCLVAGDGAEVVGVIVAVAVDHVVVDGPDGSRWLVPHAAVAGVWPAR